MRSGALKVQRSRAQSMVEFALMLPLVLAIMLGIFESGRFMAVYTGIANGARSGARVATITSATENQIRDAVVAAVALVDTTQLRSGVEISTRTPGAAMTVTVSYAYVFNPLLASLLSAGGLSTVTIQQQATMIVEEA
jgi:Flp pilus assembly protein TadG